MAEFDLGQALGSIVSNVGSYFIQQQQAKAQMKLAQQMLPMSRLPSMGLGYSAAPLPVQPLAYQYPAPIGPQLPPGSSTPSDPFGMGGTPLGSLLGYANPAAAGCSGLFTMPTTSPRARAQQLVMQPDPTTGRMHFWRHVGSPILYSGDVSHCRRVEKLLGRAGRRLHRRRPR